MKTLSVTLGVSLRIALVLGLASMFCALSAAHDGDTPSAVGAFISRRQWERSSSVGFSCC